MYILSRALIYFACFLGVVFAYVKYLESKSIFFPTTEIEGTPRDINLSFEQISILTEDNIKIDSWFIPFEGAKVTLFICHGNGGNISHRLDKITLFRKLKMNIFIIDYRGYGKSLGKPTEKGVYSDAKAAVKYLIEQKNIKLEDIVFYGESLGGAVVIDIARYYEPRALILEGTFSSVKDMAKIMYPYIPRFIFPNIFNSIKKIKDIQCPILFIHSRSDEIVPFKLGKKLYEAAISQKEFLEISGGHSDGVMVSNEKVFSAISDFMLKINKQ